MKQVSICIPAYQNEAGVKRLLESIEYQTYKNIEVVITDDSVGKEIENLAVLFGDRLPIRYRRNLKRMGPTANWNEAIRQALPESDYIKIMHHDDWFTFPDSLEKMVALLDAQPEACMAFSGTKQIPQHGTPYERFTPEEDIAKFQKDYKNLFSVGNTIGAPSAVLVRKYEKIPQYDERLKWIVDMDYYMAILKSNPCFAWTKEPLISIGMSDKQLTNSCVANPNLQITEYTYLYRKYAMQGKEAQEKLARILVENGAKRDYMIRIGLDELIVDEAMKMMRQKKIDSLKYAIKRRLS